MKIRQYKGKEKKLRDNVYKNTAFGDRADLKREQFVNCVPKYKFHRRRHQVCLFDAMQQNGIKERSRRSVLIGSR